ncbi:MAG: DNA polymerase III subunit gamma/tau [Cyanobacteria bacterium P01_F01_bin.150]
MVYEPLHHKYRPQTFAQLVGQSAIATTLSSALNQQRIAPAYLFSGPRGTGKTSSARILAKSLNCTSGDGPTAEPCGNCEICTSITNGSSLDVIEIDAASNTGVDNIRELIERSQFAPVQCRYKVYVVDECLTGDSLVTTQNGLMRIDDPNIQGQLVLSFNDALGSWEFKPVVRWLDQGTRDIFAIQTSSATIGCTDNHLIRTDRGWIAARSIKAGMKILSPVPVDAAPPSIELAQMGDRADRCADINLKATPTVKRTTTSVTSWLKPNPSPVWTTSLETVESVRPIGQAQVYDIEVEDNHNFVANGLLVHNCHMLSTAAFNALLKTLEEPPERVVFVLATTDPQRVLPTIISRCQRFDFRRIALPEMIAHLGAIARQESINIADDALQLVAQVSQGGLRDAESLLDQLSLIEGQIVIEKVWDLVGAVPERDLLALVKAIATDNGIAVLDHARHLMDRGREPLIVLQNLAGFYRDLLIAKTAGDRQDLVAITPPTWKELCEFVQTLDISTILLGQQHLRETEVQVKNTTQPRLWLEVILMGLLPSTLHPASPTQPTLVPASTTNLVPLAQPPIAQAPIYHSPQAIAPTPNAEASAASTAPPAIAPITPTASITPAAPPVSAPLPSPPPTPVPLPPAAISPTAPAVDLAATEQSSPQSPIAHTNPPTTAVPPLANTGAPVPAPSPALPPVTVSTPVPSSTPSETHPPVASPPSTPTYSKQQLDQLWQQVTALVKPPIAQTLFQQQGRFVEFDGTVAKVAIKSKQLMRLAEQRVEKLTVAFEQILGYSVRVTMEVAKLPPPTSSPSPQAAIAPPIPLSPPAPPAPITPPVPQSPPPVAPPAASSPPPAPSSIPVPHSQFTPPPPVAPSAPSSIPAPHSQFTPPPQAAPASPAPPRPPAPPALPPIHNEDAETQSIKRFANMFNGEIVELDDGDLELLMPNKENGLLAEPQNGNTQNGSVQNGNGSATSNHPNGHVSHSQTTESTSQSRPYDPNIPF